MSVPTKTVTLLDDDSEATKLEVVNTTPVDPSVSMFERLARAKSVDVEKLQKLIELQERVMVHNARSAFNRAFAAMQGEIPTIIEKGKTDKATYARLEDIVEVVRPILKRHGFTLSHRTEWPDPKTVKVVGILTHEEGHERTSEFLSSADQSGSKNAIQALGSAVAYGRRYTTKDLLAIVTKGEDDDGNRAARTTPEPTAPDGYDDWLIDLAATADEGTAKLSATWNKSRKDYRAHLTKTDNAKWEGLKKKAAKVQP